MGGVGSLCLRAIGNAVLHARISEMGIEISREGAGRCDSSAGELQ
jgi:hypothetical protein